MLLAGGSRSTTNQSYYLYRQGYAYWTMSPGRWASSSKTLTMCYAKGDGTLDCGLTASSTSDLMPVINLKANTTFQSGGLGTSDKPYVVQ